MLQRAMLSLHDPGCKTAQQLADMLTEHGLQVMGTFLWRSQFVLYSPTAVPSLAASHASVRLDESLAGDATTAFCKLHAKGGMLTGC